MKIQTFEDRDEWMAARRGRITGTRLGDIMPKRGGGMKIGYYELIAERLAVLAEGENTETPMDRGNRLQDEAMQRFTIETGFSVDTSLVIWSRDDNEKIAISPDGNISETEAVEVKCLSSARHIEAWLTKTIPCEYDEQVLQYFIVNDKLQKLHFVFYDPRISCKPYFVIEVKRDQEQVTEYLELERKTLMQVEEIINKLQAS